MSPQPPRFVPERVQVAFALQFDDSPQVLCAPPLLALRPIAEIAVVQLWFG
jgi:hypothetical protein